jgi:hypothetical protein
MTLIGQAANREGGALWHLIEDFLDWLGLGGRIAFGLVVLGLILLAFVRFSKRN